jgi:hypothetical protein
VVDASAQLEVDEGSSGGVIMAVGTSVVRLQAPWQIDEQLSSLFSSLIKAAETGDTHAVQSTVLSLIGLAKIVHDSQGCSSLCQCT